jgi:hypothetical protein
MSTVTQSARPLGDLAECVRPIRRWLAAAHRAAPALAGYAVVRGVSLVLFSAWGAWRRTPVWHRMGTLWDAAAYLRVATVGYPTAVPAPDAHGHRYCDLAFFPLYPMSVRAVHAVLPVSPPGAALLVAWAAAAAAACGIFAVAERLYGHRTGVAAALVWAALPHAFEVNLGYTEALFAALAAWTLYAALTGRWLWSGALSSAACLTRPTGIALAAAVAAAAVVRVRRAPWCWRAVLGAAVAPLGWFGFVGWVGYRLGRWNGYFTVQMAWNSHFDFGATTAGQVIQVLRDPLGAGIGAVAVTVVLLAAVVLFGYCCTARQPAVLVVFSATMLTITLGDAGAFLSRARFLLPVFPLVLPLATALARARSRRTAGLTLGAATLVSAGLGLYLTFISTSSL